MNGGKLSDRIIRFDQRYGDHIIDGIVNFLILLAFLLLFFLATYHVAITIGDDPRFDSPQLIERGGKYDTENVLPKMRDRSSESF